VGNQFVPADNPLAPNRPLPQLLGWTSSALRDDFDQSDRSRNIDALRNQAATNDSAIREGQRSPGVTPGQAVNDDLAARIRATESRASATVNSRRREVSQKQGALSEDYNATVKAGKVSPHHGGNRALWDTVGAQTDNRATLGTPPERQSIGDWHFDKDRVPIAGPKPETRESAASTAKAEQPPGPHGAARPTDRKGTTGNQ
jgi:hypothetical protein